MSLFDDLQGLPKIPDYNAPGSCRLCRHLQNMPAMDAEAVQDFLMAGGSADRLKDIMERHGFYVSASTARTHRRQGHKL